MIKDRKMDPIKAMLGCIAAALALMTTAVAAQTTQVADWRQSIAGGKGNAVSRAPNGDYVVVGIEAPSSIDASYGATMTLQRYSSGGQPVWAQPVRSATVAAGLKPSGVFADAQGNVVVLANEADFNFVFCTPSPCQNPPPPTLFNGWTIVQKHAPDGTLLWRQRALEVRLVPVQAAFDASGDVFVAFDPNSGGMTAVVRRLSGATGATLWTGLTPDGARPGGLALSSTGSVLLAASGTFFGLSINEFAADTGARLTRTTYPAAAGYYAPGMALGPQGEIAFTGQSADGLFVGLENAARQTLFTASTTPGAQARQIAVDAQGRIVVAGTAPGTTGSNWLLVRYGPTGTSLHAPVIIDRHASAAEQPLGLAVAADGAAYVTGAAGPGTATDPNAMQAVTVRLAAGGAIDWLASEAAGVRGVGAALATDNSVAVLTAGDMSLVHYPVLAGPTPTALTLSSTSVRGGNSVTGRVTLSSTRGAAVTLTSSNPAVAWVPSTVNVAAGSSSASFTVRTARVRTTTSVTITATANGKSVSTVLTVRR
jgi:hypothetical protein